EFAPAILKIDGAEHAVSFGPNVKFSGHVIQGFGGPAKIVNPPLPDPIHKEFEQGNNTYLNYSDSKNHQIDAKGSNYMYATFTTDSAEYEKFQQEMMKMMESKK